MTRDIAAETLARYRAWANAQTINPLLFPPCEIDTEDDNGT